MDQNPLRRRLPPGRPFDDAAHPDARRASDGNPLNLIQSFEQGLGEGDNVRGAMVGRNVLFPGDDDPFAVAEAVGKLIHEDASAKEAVRHLARVHGQDIDWLKESLA